MNSQYLARAYSTLLRSRDNISSSIINKTNCVVGCPGSFTISSIEQQRRRQRCGGMIRSPRSCVGSSRMISSSALTIERAHPIGERSERLKNLPPKEEVVFGSVMSDHMLTIEWDSDNKWNEPRIVPFQDLRINPAATCLHYGLQCFEGLKAYKSIHDETELRLFRPDMNMKRLKSSMERLHLPGADDFDDDELIHCIKELIKIDRDWIPHGEGYSLYIRPTVIATQGYLSVAPPKGIMLFVITSPVGPYYKSGFQPVKLTADSEYIRAWPGGTGNAKVGGNYASTIKPQSIALETGYSQNLWLFGDDDIITEVGAMNVFFLVINKTTGRKELITPPLTRGDILPGVTRDSVLQLTRSWVSATTGTASDAESSDDDADFDVVERSPTMGEIKDAADDGRLVEAFGTGTAAVVTPISAIQYKATDIDIPATGSLTKRIYNAITGIQYGKIRGPDGWSVVI